MSRLDEDRARDILAAITEVRAAGRLLDRYDPDPDLADAVINAVSYLVIVVGEAVKGLSAEATNAHPEVPWSNIARMRDVLSHHYWRRDAQVVMRTVGDPMDILAAACEQLLASSDPAAGANRPGLSTTFR